MADEGATIRAAALAEPGTYTITITEPVTVAHFNDWLARRRAAFCAGRTGRTTNALMREAARTDRAEARAARKAESNARALLGSYLTTHQRRTLRTHGFFWLRSGDGVLYAVLRGEQRSVCARGPLPIQWTVHHLWPEGEHGFPLCDADVMLTHLLLLRAEPLRFHQTACSEYLHYRENNIAQGPDVLRRACLPGFLAEEQRLAHPNQGVLKWAPSSPCSHP